MHRPMRSLRTHGVIYLLLLAVVFVAFGRIMAVPLYDTTDARTSSATPTP